MQAVVFNQAGDASVLHLEERAIPEIKENDVLIEVYAAGVNRPDVIQRNGKYPAPEGIVQDILGLEVSGKIIKTGAKAASQWQVGQEICALIPGGGYAQYVAADAGSCLPVPKGISTEDAAALPEVLFTVWHNLFQRIHLQKGEDVLIYGGSGGIGSMAIQLAHLFGASVSTLVSTETKAAYCLSLGADRVINYKEQDIVDALGTNSTDAILDCIGGDYLDKNIDLLRPDGRLVYINAMEGAQAMLAIKKMMKKRLLITGSTLRARSYDFKKALADDIRTTAFPLLEDEHFQSMVKYRFPAEEAAEAHALMDSRDFTGKIVICF